MTSWKTTRVISGSATNRGLSKFNPFTEEFRNFFPSDGLQGYEYNRRAACYSKNGLMYFGGFNGFNTFDPEKINDKFPEPAIVITSLKKWNKESNQLEELEPVFLERDVIELSYQDSILSFGFSALSYFDPINNQYKYKLEPKDKDWIPLGNKHNIDFTNLEPGQYTLTVIGANFRGVWNKTGKSIKIFIAPPFWETLWFRILIFIASIISMLFLIKLRTRNMAALNRRLEEQVKKRTVEISQQKENLRITNERLEDEIIQHKHALQSFKESEERYRTLVETSPDAIILSKLQDGGIVMANKQSAFLCGYTDEQEMINQVKTIFALLDKDSRIEMLKNTQSLKESSEKPSNEYNLLAKDGTSIVVEIHSALVTYAEKNDHYFLSIIRDIRERKEAQRQEELRREKAIQEDKMATLGRLVSGVAHELNNPASTMKMNSEIFARAWKDVSPIIESYYLKNKNFTLAGIPYANAKDRLDNLIFGLMNSAQRIEKIIKDLKDYSRPTDFSINEPIHINQVILSAINITQSLLKKSTNHYFVNVDQELPVLMGNPLKLEQVLINLIQNACYALTNTEQSISITAYYEESKKEIVIEVKDEGVGIAEKDLNSIMDPFFTTRRSSGGTGLGLSISQQIIQDHGGTITFHSELGKGTLVTVRLPIRSMNTFEKRKESK